LLLELDKCNKKRNWERTTPFIFY